MRRWPVAGGPCFAVYAVLTWLVWGSHAFERTLWQDDAQHLFRVFSEPGGPISGAFIHAANTPTRAMLHVPFALALLSGAPREALQVFYGGAWLMTAWLAHLLARRLFGDRLAPLLAGSLTASATSDFLTDSVVALPGLCALALCFAAILAALRWLDGGPAPWLLLACSLVQASLFVCEYAVPAVLLAPGIFWLARDRRVDRRLIGGTLFWYATAIPYFILLAHFLRDSAGYAGTALQSRTAADLAGRAASLFLHNFTPWTWAFQRAQWFPAPEASHSSWLRGGAAALGAATFAGVACHRLRTRQDPRGRGPALALVFACLALALAANAPFAVVQFSERFVRTHLHSRVWAALGLAGLGEYFWARCGPSPRRLLAVAVAAAFIALGVWGGVERQDYFLGYSHRHRQELTSIFRQVPGLAPEAALILQAPPHPRLLATEAPYLARAWLTLLYQDPSVECRVFLWSAAAGSTCEAQADGFLCRGEISPRCVPAGLPRQQYFAYARVLLLTYEPASNTWALLRSGSSPPLPPPESLVVARGPSPLARNLIGAVGGDGR